MQLGCCWYRINAYCMVVKNARFLKERPIYLQVCVWVIEGFYEQFCLYSFRLRNKCGLGDIIMYAKLICDFNTALLDRYIF